MHSLENILQDWHKQPMRVGWVWGGGWMENYIVYKYILSMYMHSQWSQTYEKITLFLQVLSPLIEKKILLLEGVKGIIYPLGQIHYTCSFEHDSTQMCIESPIIIVWEIGCIRLGVFACPTVGRNFLACGKLIYALLYSLSLYPLVRGPRLCVISFDVHVAILGTRV